MFKYFISGRYAIMVSSITQLLHNATVLVNALSQAKTNGTSNALHEVLFSSGSLTPARLHGGTLTTWA